MIAQNTDFVTNRKSASLTPDELRDFKKFMGKYLTVAAAADAIGIERQKLDRFLLAKRSSPETIEKIKAAIA